jgi:hypothetical protein
MPTWSVFAAARLLVVCAVAVGVLDVVRTLEAFTVYEVLYFFAWRRAVWFAHPAVSGPVVEWLASGCLLVLGSGVLAAITLKLVGRFKWVRPDTERGISWKRALLIIPATSLISVAEVMITCG